MLREVLPTGVPGFQVPWSQRRSGSARVAEVIATLLTQPSASGDIVAVCHGNLIRVVVCRVLKAPATAWYTLGAFHCGITTFRFRPSGDLELQSFNDAGHLPQSLRTT